jgi:hypothetical protein
MAKTFKTARNDREARHRFTKKKKGLHGLGGR